MKRGAGALALLLGLLCGAPTPPAWSADRVRITVAGPERGVNAQIARDIAKYVAKPADIEFELRLAAGPADTLLKLREGSGQQFALLPADVAPAFLGAAARGNLEAGQLLAPLRIIAPLHEEEIHFIVRSDSPLNFVHEIEQARINLGPLQGPTALSVATLYRLMFDAALPEKQTSFHSHQEALVKLTEQGVDVVALVAPRPLRLLADMKPEARRFIKLLKFDANHPSAGETLKVYSATSIPAASYPRLLDEDLPGLAVGIYLVSHGRNDVLQARFADAWCHNLPRLSAEGHPALRGLQAAAPRLTSGWHYSRPFERELRACREGKRAPAEICSPEDRALGLCG